MAIDNKLAKLCPDTVPLGTGPPTREEMLVYYPAKFTWKQLKTFVNSGDLGLLKRDKALQKRYDAWAAGIRAKYGSMGACHHLIKIHLALRPTPVPLLQANFLLNYRLQWGKEDTITLLRSSLEQSADAEGPAEVPEELLDPKVPKKLPPLPPNAPSYFKADMPREMYCITMNDWPYSVPPEVEHSLIWSRVPILPPDLPPPLIVPNVLDVLASAALQGLRRMAFYSKSSKSKDKKRDTHPDPLPEGNGSSSSSSKLDAVSKAILSPFTSSKHDSAKILTDCAYPICYSCIVCAGIEAWQWPRSS
ncbi:hypothetical protein NUW54_g9746 [Trametes sanguinea]|uniref:Uncharacterized protein n=1 Tax=Trametes sanguinea TaxID=158606 RepID=A0ACC1P525_9APHY|nr:hypothetical protein NUW54_g9746 [Trametes sanguinea]